MIQIIIILFFLLSKNIIFGVSTKYINDFKFENFEIFDFSNITFIQDYGFELSKETELYFTNSDMIWCIEKFDKNFLIGCGDIATVILKNNYTNYIIFQNSNYLIVSDIKVINNQIYISVFPDGALFILDKNFKIIKKIEITNQYIWKILDYKNNIILLTGNPAQIYFLSNNNLIQTINFNYEDNIIDGEIIDNILYFICDSSYLYKLNLDSQKSRKKFMIVASFENSINSIIEYNKELILTVSSKEFTPKQQTSAGQEDTMISQMKREQPSKQKTESKSVLYKYNPLTGIELIYENKKIPFNAVSIFNNNYIIGTDKNGGYLEIDPQGKLIKFTSFGDGRFIRFFESEGSLYAILLDPSRIIKINKNYSKYGYFKSSIFNAGIFSSWGVPYIDYKIPPQTEIKIWTRSGAVYDDKLWEEWKILERKIESSPNQFIQYKVELISFSNNTPLFKGIQIPYLQKNLPPIFKNVRLNYNNNAYRLFWECYDENNDIINYDLYIKITNENEWIKLNDKPIEENYFDIYKENFPEGNYNLKIIAYDRNSNPEETALSNFYISDIFQIDNTPPFIGDIKIIINNEMTTINFEVEDKNSLLMDVFYNLDGKKWIKISPNDGILDNKKEYFSLNLKLNKPTFLQIKAIDIFGNFQTKGIYIK